MRARHPRRKLPQVTAGSDVRRGMRFEYLLQEMADCRQDDRDSITQILSVVAAGIAALVIVINALSDGDEAQTASEALDSCAPLILAGIVAIAFSYMLSLGLRSTLRYQYMRMLADELKALGGVHKDFMGWTELSAPLVTLNPRHIKSVYTAAYFGSVLFAVAAAATVCVSLVAISAIKSPFGFAAGALMAAFFACFVLVMLTMSDARSMMCKIQSLARERKAVPATAVLAGSEPKPSAGSWLAFIRYLLYPHPQDLLKVLFVVFGFLWGCFLAGSNPFSAGSLRLLILLLVVFDVLGYQARYQINDIRGYSEDKRNPASEKRGRLSSFGVPELVAVYGSAAAAVLKIVAGAAVVLFAPVAPEAQIALGMAYMLIFAIAIVYEYSRSRKHAKWPFRLVGLGYPLRIGAGVFFALGSYAPAVFLASSSIVSITLVLAAAFLFGWSFVGITWLLECCAAHGGDSSDVGDYHKAHVERLRKLAISRDGGFDPASRYYPLLHHDSPRNVWNWSLIASAALMLLATFVLLLDFGDKGSAQPGYVSLLQASGTVLLIVGLLVYAAKPDRATVGFAALGLAAVVSVTSISVCCYRGDYLGCAGPAILLAAIVYVLICLSFKGVNYFEMADFLGGVRFGVIFVALSSFSCIFRWPLDEDAARKEVKHAKEGLEAFNRADEPETTERRSERQRKEQKLDEVFQRYVGIFSRERDD